VKIVGKQLQRVIRRMVDEPEAVRVSSYRARGATHFKLRLADDDLGKVIGRQGRTAWALRAILEARGERDGREYALEIRDS